MAVQRRIGVLGVSVALVAVGLPAFGGAAAQAATRPGPVTNLAAFQLHGPVTVRWTNPSGIDSDVVRIARGFTAPASVSSGRGITLAHAQANHAVLRDLAAGRVYSVSVWTHGTGGRSHRTSTTFTTMAPPPASRGITGTVTDRAGHPLRNAQVVIDDVVHYLHTKTDSAGRFFAPADFALVMAAGPHATGGTSDAAGYGSSASRLAHAGNEVHLVLPAGGQVRGRVTDVAGNPAAGLAATPGILLPYLWPDSGGFGVSFGPDVATPRTNHNGYYTLRGVPATATLPCVSVTPASGAFAPRCATSSVAPAVGTTVTAPTIVVEHAKTATLTGTVTGKHGIALPHVQLGINGLRGKANNTLAVSTDAHGRYRAANLLTGPYDVCAAPVARDGLGYRPKCRVVHLQGPARADLALRRGGALSGVVRGPSGHGIGGVLVSARDESGRGGGGNAVTRGDGSYTVSGLGTGNYLVCFDPSGRSARASSFAPSCRHTDLAVTQGRSRIGADGTLSPGGAVTGVVHDASGAPVRNALVYLERLGRVVSYGIAMSDGRGRFAAGGLAAGTYRVCAEPLGVGLAANEQCGTPLVSVTAGRTTRNAVVTFAQHPSVHLHVTDAGGHPLSGVDVALLKPCTGSFCTVLPVFGARGMHVIDSVMTDAAGNADFGSVRAGHYGLCALAYYGAAASVAAPTGYADKCTNGFTVSTSDTAPATLQLDPGGVVTGRVLDSAGHGIRHARVTVAGATTDGVQGVPFDIGPTPFDDLYTDSRGRYSIHSVRPGRRSVCATAHGFKRGCLASAVPVTASTVTSADPLTLNARAFAVSRGVARPARPVRTNRYEVVRFGQWSGLKSLSVRAFLHQVVRFGGAGALIHLR